MKVFRSEGISITSLYHKLGEDLEVESHQLRNRNLNCLHVHPQIANSLKSPYGILENFPNGFCRHRISDRIYRTQKKITSTFTHHAPFSPTPFNIRIGKEQPTC